MPNSFFRFKQFTVQQQDAAMKVCTDACLFAAVVVKEMRRRIPLLTSALDIGTGTGLLSLMIAQENSTADIDAIEIDVMAAEQAKANFNASPWKDRLFVHNTAAQKFSQAEKAYDLIISNPPFFENDLKSSNDKRNLALHSSKLGLQELLLVAEKYISEESYFAVLLPYQRIGYFIEIASGKRLNLCKKVLVKQTPKHNYFRSILIFSRNDLACEEYEITIQQPDRKYTPEFIDLLKEYYLYL